MKTCLLNLPYPARLMRRYNCTYYAPNFLFPPLELMYLGAIVREWKKDSCILIDAIAENLSIEEVIRRLKGYQPDILVFMSGIESFTFDMHAVTRIKSHFGRMEIICIGYLPTIFPKETLEANPAIDYVIMNEAEISFSELYDQLKEKAVPKVDVAGIALREKGEVVVNTPRERIVDLDMLPFADRTLIKQDLYGEVMTPRPFTIVQTSRGCPFSCSFCIRTFGREVAYRSLDNIIFEIASVAVRYKVKTIHFMDDTFTLNKPRVIDLCARILKEGIKFQWTALSRVGLADKEMVNRMKEAGLRRIYLGIETNSQRLLDYYRKGYKIDSLKDEVFLYKQNGVEVAGFFLVGGPQTEGELKEDITAAKELGLDFVVVEKITPYPGTKVFQDMRDKIDFRLFPYLNVFKDGVLEKQGIEFEKIFYKSFYINVHYFLKMLKYLFINPRCLIDGAIRLIQYLFFSRSQEIRQELI